MPDSSEEEGDLSSSRFSRRSLIKAGAIVGGTVWLAPVIDSFTSRAAAASSIPTGQGFSSVTILICDSVEMCYRLKFDVSCFNSTGTFPVTTSSCTSGGCGPHPRAPRTVDAALTPPRLRPAAIRSQPVVRPISRGCSVSL
jgi:hypothetical protein